MDEREQRLRRWARSLDGAWQEARDWDVVAGDASSRRYFRLLTGDQSWIGVDAPPATEKNGAFLQVDSLLDQAGARVPAVLAADVESGFFILEDLGDQLLLGQLNEHSAEEQYGQALDLLLRMQLVPATGAGLPAYERDLLAEELSRFPEWFCGGLLQLELSATDRELIDDLGDKLISNALEQPQVFVHRDYHSRNLLMLPDGSLATIDFQDAVVGPLCYDLVSLLRDCYICWSPSQVRHWALAYRRRLERERLPAGDDDTQFLRWFDWIGLQRHLKVLGNFARLSLRDGKPNYLRDIPLVLHYVREVLFAYPEFAQALAWIDEVIAPRVAAQDWSGGQ